MFRIVRLAPGSIAIAFVVYVWLWAFEVFGVIVQQIGS